MTTTIAEVLDAVRAQYRPIGILEGLTAYGRRVSVTSSHSASDGTWWQVMIVGREGEVLAAADGAWLAETIEQVATMMKERDV